MARALGRCRVKSLAAGMSLVIAAACGDGSDTVSDAGRLLPDAFAVVPDAPGLDAPRPEGEDVALPEERDASTPPSDSAAPGDSGMVRPGTDPSSMGPHTVSETMATVEADRRTPVTAYVPSLPDGVRVPLVLFLPGFQLNTSQYAGTLRHLASHGFVVVGANPTASLLSVNHVQMAADGRAVIAWATREAPFASRVDASRVGVSGHSLGGKLATLITMDDMSIDALLAIDPVDGDPSPLGGGGSRDRPDIVPSRGADVRVPAGFLGETTNSRGGGFGMMACAPADQNFMQFYAAVTMAPWAAQWDVAGADHMDFLDDPAACGFTCSVCPDGPADDAAVLRATRTIVTAFFRRHLAAEAAMDAYLIGGSVPAGVAVMHRP